MHPENYACMSLMDGLLKQNMSYELTEKQTHSAFSEPMSAC